MSSFAFQRKIAFRYLWSKRSEAFITIITVISVLGVAIGVMVLNMVMAVMTGFEHTLREKIVAANSHIVVRHESGKVTGWREAAEEIRSVPGVESVSVFTYHQALLRTELGSTGLLIRGIEKGSSAAEQLATYLGNDRAIDNLFDPPKVAVPTADGNVEEVALPGLIIGRTLQKNFQLFANTPVSILSPQVSSTPFGLVPRFRRFVIAGVYRSGLSEYEGGLAYAALPEAQRFFNMGDAVSGMEVRVHDVEQSAVIAQQILGRLGGQGGGFAAEDWTEANRPLWEAIRLEKKVYFIVLLLIVVMASFSIISTLIMIVLEKRKDVAVLKTLGATDGDIARIFRIQGSVIGLIGTVTGLILGAAGCWALDRFGFPLDERIFQMSQVPVRVEPLNFALVAVCAFLICFFATFYPARRASSLQPSDVLRHE